MSAGRSEYRANLALHPSKVPQWQHPAPRRARGASPGMPWVYGGAAIGLMLAAYILPHL